MKNLKKAIVPAVLILAGAAVAAGKAKDAGAALPSGKAADTAAATAGKAPDPAAVQEAEKHYANFCNTCHGLGGKGDGIAGGALNPKPANFTDPAFQKARTDEQLTKAILEGGAAVGKSPLMPGSPQFKGKPEVIRALVMKVRSFGGK